VGCLASRRARLERFGPNEIAEEHKSALLVLLGYFWAPIPWMIEVALVLSLAVRHWTDAAVIGVLLAMNVAVAFTEEHQAANAIAALKQRLAATARVLRDGAWATVPARDLVPGDVIRVRLGDVPPADARLLGDASLQVDQSALTGESLPTGRLGHAHHPGHRHRTRRHRGGGHVHPVRRRRPGLRAQPRANPHPDLPETVSSGAADHLPDRTRGPFWTRPAPAPLLLGAVPPPS
jgi:magnesium-transporting ATPase (P-type)